MNDNRDSVDPSPYASPIDSSPYAPPLEIDDSDKLIPLPTSDTASPIVMSGAYAIIAALVNIVPIWASGTSDRFLFPMLLGMPLIEIAFFVVICFAWFGGPAALPGRSRGWKVLMVLLVPPASLLLFIPTCVGTGIVALPLLGSTNIFPNELALVIPVFAAYWVTCVVVAFRLRSRLQQGDVFSLSSPVPEDSLPSDLLVAPIVRQEKTE